eukprot:6854843-Pyramimonas_sp.AAC.1
MSWGPTDVHGISCRATASGEKQYRCEDGGNYLPPLCDTNKEAIQQLKNNGVEIHFAPHPEREIVHFLEINNIFGDWLPT